MTVQLCNRAVIYVVVEPETNRVFRFQSRELFVPIKPNVAGGWNEGVSLDEMKLMAWVEPRLVVQIAFV